MKNPDSANVAILFPAAGRTARLNEINTGTAPAEFFYGAFGLDIPQHKVIYGDTRRDPTGPLARVSVAFTRGRNAFMNFGLAKPRVEALKETIDASVAAFSFTDAYSISLGYYRNLLRGNTTIVGGFHGLCDMVNEVRPFFQGHARRVVQRGVAGLDIAFFFGPADLEEAVSRFDLQPERAFLFPFGVDTDFWSPATGEESGKPIVFAAGSDPKRDFKTLLEASFPAKTRILTRLRLPSSANRPDVEVVRGSYHNAAITDSVLRELYRTSHVVAIPVRDVFQPSGYSVALQAMACGKPIVLTKFKGLWDPDKFRHGENCMLVEPGSPDAISAAVKDLFDNPELREKIGHEARHTALRSFSLARMNDGLENLIETSLRLGQRRAA